MSRLDDTSWMQAALVEARAAQQEEAGNLTKAERKRIDRKADKILGEGKGDGKADDKG